MWLSTDVAQVRADGPSERTWRPRPYLNEGRRTSTAGQSAGSGLAASRSGVIDRATMQAYTEIVRLRAMVNPSSIVHSDPEILGGIPVFVGTRVPLKSLYDHLEA